MLRAIASFTLALVTAVACAPPPPPLAEGEGEGAGEGEGEGDGDGDSSLPASRYCEELVDVFCPFYVRCGRMNVADVAACRAAFPASCEAKFEPRFAPLSSAGLLTLSASGLEACAEHLADVPCDQQFFELSGPCAGIWQGEVAAGGACGLDVETFVCAPGTTCTLDLSFCGVCEAVLPLGAPCRTATGDGVEGACGPAAVCGDDDHCVRRPAAGEACAASDVPCALPARCAADGVCREPLVVAVGEACDSARRCPYFAACDGGVCVALAGAGGACRDDADCEASWCDAGTCTVLAAAGEACVRDAQCGSGRCDGDVCGGFEPLCVGG